MAISTKPRRVLIIVENLPCPFDRRVWQEATTLHKAGYQVSVICPTGKGYDKKYEILEDIHIFRHKLPIDARGILGYALEYSSALFWEFVLAWKVFFKRGFDVIHACNPPDNIFLIGAFFKLFGKKFVFDHHDCCPELYRVKFGPNSLLYKLIIVFEKLTFKTADISIATNESYKRIAVDRGGMSPERVFVVRSGPDLEKLRSVTPDPELKRGYEYLVGYLGVMGAQDGVDYLLRAIHFIVRTKKRTNIHFILAGGGPELERLKEYTHELGIGSFVTFTGWLHGEQLLSVLSTIDIGVSPDIANGYNEKCTMNKVMEYMAIGKPLVQFDLAEGRYSAEGASLYAENNDFKDLAEKIMILLDNPQLREEMGRIGQERIKTKLQWCYEAPNLLKAYEVLFTPNHLPGSELTRSKERL